MPNLCYYYYIGFMKLFPVESYLKKLVGDRETQAKITRIIDEFEDFLIFPLNRDNFFLQFADLTVNLTFLIVFSAEIIYRHDQKASPDNQPKF